MGVELPKGFYLGFSQYANSLPSEAAAPRLALQLRIIEKIVTSLIDFKVQSIDTLNRLPLPEESGIVAGGLKTCRSQATRFATEGFEALPFDLAFTAEQGKLRVAFNSLARFRSIPDRPQSGHAKYGARRSSGLSRKRNRDPTQSPGSRGGTGRQHRRRGNGTGSPVRKRTERDSWP